MARKSSEPLSGAIASFLHERTTDVRPLRAMTAEGYGRSLRRFDKTTGGGPISELTPVSVGRFVSRSVRAGHTHMARNDMQALKSFAKWLAKKKILVGLRGGSVLDGLEMPKAPKRGREPFTNREAEIIMRVASESREGARDAAICWFAVLSGLRMSEIRNLRWPEDVSLEDRIIFVRQSKTDAGIRKVRIEPKLLAIIDGYVQDERPHQEPGPLFLNQHGRPFTYQGFARVFSRLHDRLKAHGIDFKLHRLRHTWTTNADRSGWSVFQIQEAGGWSSLEMVRRYVGRTTIEEMKRLPSIYEQMVK